MWQNSGRLYGNKIAYRYAVCTGGHANNALKKEADKYGDMMLMGCEEGYLNGILTRKVAAAMKYYTERFSSFELFMKIDDDAYLSTNRLCDFMDTKHKNGIDMHKAYQGVFAEGNEKLNVRHGVIRDKSSAWFEPYEKYPGKNYPISAKGGPGYILPYASVKEIVDTGIAAQYELNNEDKAVGYWVTKLKHKPIKHWVNLPGTDGYDEHKQYNYRIHATWGDFKGYPFVVHHHLEGAEISCMHEVEFTMDPEATIDHCFKMNLFGIRKEHVRIHMPY